ncbi:UPF0262 family protein [Rhizobium sp. NPDC090275]|uniref:UPF0262 family protein n=1 Tax=Rhizobium sp. NPDC090275 TaxID=3364498 RepID=UPI00383B07F3
MSERNHLCDVQVEHDESRLNPAVLQEQSLAIEDLLETSQFELVGRNHGPYRLKLSTRGSRLSLHVANEENVLIVSHIMSFTPFKDIICEYVMICEAHLRASMTGDPYRIESIDMGRRAIHNTGSELLQQRLSSRIKTDLDTARRLFTVIVAPYTVSLFA